MYAESFQTSEDCIAIEFQFAVILHFVTSSCKTEEVFNNLFKNKKVDWAIAVFFLVHRGAFASVLLATLKSTC